MTKYLSILLTNVLLLGQVFAVSDVARADRHFTLGNIDELGQVYNKNPKNRTIAYLYAKAQLSKNNPAFAERFIHQPHFDDYMRSDILHQLLALYSAADSKPLSDYRRVYRLLPHTQTTIDEQCTMDSITGSMTIDSTYIATNNPSPWCAKVLAAAYLKAKLDKKHLDWMLYNLIANDKTNIYNQLAPSLQLGTINFAAYANKAVDKLPDNDFLIINRITDIGYKHPDDALAELKKANISENANVFLSNYLAMQLAQKHNFKQALELYENYGDNLSDNQYEWLARSYLYMANWEGLISTIDDMPRDLYQKNVWLYWRAKAFSNLNGPAKASQYFKLIPKDYSYYAMLANSALGVDTIYYNTPPKTTTLGNSNNAKAALIGLNLYKEGKKNKANHLMTIGSAQWNYAVRMIKDDNLLLAMSNLAQQHSYYAMSIYAANQMKKRYIELGFPLPWRAIFTQYSKLFGMDPTYTLAVCRQESRFNYQVVAFDGGVGLMQIMPQTAAHIAHKTGWVNCYNKSLVCNIKFGAWYLGDLNSKFGNLIYSTAAYNAGPHRPRLWQDNLGKLDNLIQIELIPISITRDYVQKVLSNKALYDSILTGTYKINLAQYITKIGTHHYSNVVDDDNTDASKLK